MRDTLAFLTELSFHNDREWFTAHKDWYVACHKRFEALTAEYIRRLGQLDPTMANLQPKDCIWRIYRDVRFSLDKRPYKEWFGTFPAPGGGKHSPQGGYYLHIQPGHSMFAAGIWCPEPDLLKTLRREIEANYDEVEEIMSKRSFKRYFTDFDKEWSLKKVPAGFDPNFVHADWLKLKAFTVSTPLTDEEVCAPDFMDHLMDIAKAAKPINDFLNYTFTL